MRHRVFALALCVAAGSAHAQDAQTAIQKYCAHSSPSACGMFTHEAGECVGTSILARQYMIVIRNLEASNGLTAHQAANIGGFEMQWLAEAAAEMPSSMSPETFGQRVFNVCLNNAAR